MSKLIFKASKYLADSEENAEMYLTDIDTRSWVDECNSKEVIMKNAWVGKVKADHNTPSYPCFVLIDWCEVIENDEI